MFKAGSDLVLTCGVSLADVSVPAGGRPSMQVPEYACRLHCDRSGRTQREDILPLAREIYAISSGSICPTMESTQTF